MFTVILQIAVLSKEIQDCSINSVYYKHIKASYSISSSDFYTGQILVTVGQNRKKKHKNKIFTATMEIQKNIH